MHPAPRARNRILVEQFWGVLNLQSWSFLCRSPDHWETPQDCLALKLLKWKEPARASLRMTRTREGKHCSLGTTDSGMAPGVLKWRRPTKSPTGLLDVKSRAHKLPTPNEGPWWINGREVHGCQVQAFSLSAAKANTWTSPDGQHQNQIDYILCSQRWRSSIQSTKTRPGADSGSDHELLIAKFRLKLKKVGKTTRPFRYDLNQIPYDYTVEVRNRFKGLDLIECVMNYGWRFMTLYRRQEARPSPR